MADDDEDQKKEARELTIRERRDSIVELLHLAVEKLGTDDDEVKALPQGHVFIRPEDYDVIPAVHRIVNRAGFEQRLLYLLALPGDPLPGG